MPLLQVGDVAPAFTLPDQSGTPRSLSEFAGGPVVLYFYPKADTPGCTTQACGFNEALPLLRGVGAQVIGISPDPTKPIAKFAAKYNLTFPLLGDLPDAASGVPTTIDAYGVWGEKSMYGKKYMGVLRTTYLLDGQGRITHRFDAVKVEGHAQEVLAALRGGPAPTAPASMNGQASASPARKPAQKTAATKKPAAKAPSKASKKAAPKAKQQASKKISKKAAKKPGKPAPSKTAKKAKKTSRKK